MSTGLAPSGGSQGESISLCFPASRDHSHSLVNSPASPHIFSPCFNQHFAFFPFCSQIYLCFSLIRIFVIAFRVHLDNPGQPPYLRTLNHICKIPFAIEGNTHSLQVLGYGYLWWGLGEALCSLPQTLTQTARRKWKTFKILKERKYKIKILYPAKITFRYNGYR